MRLRYEDNSESSLTSREDLKEKGKEKWYNKLWDVAAKIGEKIERIACVVSVPVLIALAPSCSCSRTILTGEPSFDASSDERDGREVEDDAQCKVEDIPEESPAPCENLTERYKISNLIGDHLNRRLNDRVDNEVGNLNAQYPFETAEASDNANPFSDGEGGNIGPAESFLHRVSGAEFAPLSDFTVRDEEAAKTYREEQNVWIKGNSHYTDSLGDVTGDISFVAYTVKFSGENNSFGIPVCTVSAEGDYTDCKKDGGSTSYDYATELHKVRIKFLGSEWVITEMFPPADSVTDEIKVQNGGFVKLGKERVSGIINAGESFEIDCLKFKLEDVEVYEDTTAAVISLLDENGNILKKDKVEVGITKEFNIDGRMYRLHVWKTGPGHDFSDKWADISILSDEIKVEDGQYLDPDYDRFREWTAVVGWKNKDAAALHANVQPDHLRTIGIYAADVGAISSSGDENLLKGEGFNFPYGELSLCYDGLDIADEERSTLTFELENIGDLEISATSGPIDPVSGRRVACTVYVPYVKISSEIPLILSGESLETTGNTAYVATSGANCEGTIGELEPGSVFIAPSLSPYYEFARYENTTMLLAFDREEIPGERIGNVAWARFEDGGTGYIDHPEMAVNLKPDFVFRVIEYSGGGSGNVAGMYFGSDGNSFNLDVNYVDSGEPVFRGDHMVYKWAGPVNSRGTFSFVEEGFITERGSVFRTIDDTQVIFDIADRVGYSVFYLGKR